MDWRRSTESSGVSGNMHKTVICLLCCTVVLLQSCRTVTRQSVSESVNGRFKVMVRTQEFNNSGSDIVDICVANSSDHEFPDTKTSQCFLNGYDFAGLAIKWDGPSVIEVSFRSGRVAQFTNSALVSPGGPVPVTFHTLLCDGCDPASKDAGMGGVK
jgi:hypothetical protein